MSTAAAEIAHERHCQKCGYNLRGLVEARCPECGEKFDPTEREEANIPWLKRHVIGTWEAFWQTVFMAMFHPRMISHELWEAHRVEPKSAMRFRRIVIAQASVCHILAIVVDSRHVWQRGAVFHYKEFITLSAMAVIVVSLFLIVATDLIAATTPAWDSQGVHLWRRALNHYACAPLVISPLVLLLTLAAIIGGDAIQGVASFVLLIMVVWWWLDNVLIMHIVKQSTLSTLAYAATLAASWVIIAMAMLICGLSVGFIVSFSLHYFR